MCTYKHSGARLLPLHVELKGTERMECVPEAASETETWYATASPQMYSAKLRRSDELYARAPYTHAIPHSLE
jgi:hypothetical protein